MALYLSIQEELKHISGDEFEALCNDFIPQWKPNYRNFHPNMVIGKKKTRKGKPDAYAVLNNGSYVLFEYTTVEPTGLFKKLRDDLSGAIALKKTKFKSCTVESIVLCCNSKLPDPSVCHELYELANKSDVHLEIWTLDILSQELQRFGPVVRRHLGISVPLSQVFTPAEFIRNDNLNTINTPLSNPLIGRQEELKEVEQALKDQNIVVISGKTGAGKTKLAYEVLIRWVQSSSKVEGFCVRNTSGGNLIDEIQNVWDKSKDAVILVDDANYFKEDLLALAELIAQVGTEKIKVLITVRDYVFEEVRTSLGTIRHFSKVIGRLPMEDREKILRNSPYNLSFHAANRIEEIAQAIPG